MSALGTQPLRIMHVLLSMGVGGVEQGVKNVVTGLDQLGFRQCIMCLENRGTLSEDVPPGVPVWACGESGGSSRPEALWQLSRRIREFAPDIIHARNCTAWLYSGCAWKMTGSRGRLVFSILGLDWEGPVAPVRTLAYRYLAKRTAALLAVSTSTADEFSSATAIPRRQFLVLRSRVDTEVFRPRVSGDPQAGDENCTVGCVARLGKRKGHEDLLRALWQVQQRGSCRVCLIVAGDGPQRSALKQLAEELGISKSVRFLGEVRDVPSLLQRVDIFVLPSLSEGRPTSIMEAMAAGLPLVATRVGAVESLVAHGTTGFLIEPRDADSLALAISNLAKDPALRRALGAAGRRVAETQFGVESMVAAYEAVYQSLARCSSHR